MVFIKHLLCAGFSKRALEVQRFGGGNRTSVRIHRSRCVLTSALSALMEEP